MTKSVVSVIACQTCLSYETDKPPFLYFLVASLVDNASCLSCHGAFRPIGCKPFAYVAVLACTTFVGRDGIEPPQARQCVRIPYGYYLPSCS